MRSHFSYAFIVCVCVSVCPSVRLSVYVENASIHAHVTCVSVSLADMFQTFSIGFTPSSALAWMPSMVAGIIPEIRTPLMYITLLLLLMMMMMMMMIMMMTTTTTMMTRIDDDDDEDDDEEDDDDDEDEDEDDDEEGGGTKKITFGVP